ncbi:hypothetical protein [Rhizobium alvei]|uniref:Uncharacterized protein n=1 Tax=Rhizobium alvei TaxID=1132659 RepID=A0ABT8YFE1_9HYPH|nr:hypothetical protein [Rhizobium alvei]MDO6962427.1 hypothetical protein [Rhizobium alvei]
MGRLAGPSLNPAAAEAQKAAQKRFDDEIRYRAAIRPLAHPPATRRQRALLWLLSEQDSMIVGSDDQPPLTRDMRALLAKRLLKLERRIPSSFWGPISEKTPRKNHLSITAAGRAALVDAKIPEQDKLYIRAALYTGVAR